jgi:hypothetical protein
MKEQITDLEKGRLIVKFMNQQSKPMANRLFYEKFYDNQAIVEK